VLKSRLIPVQKHFWEICFGKRPADEIYDLRRDPDCVTNLAATVSVDSFQRQLFSELKAQDDPRMSGNGRLFDEYPDASPGRGFYDKFTHGQ